MAERRQHLQHRPRDAVLLFGRLVRVGVGAQRQHRGAVAGPPQLGVEQVGGIGLGEQARFKVDAGRQAQVGVRRPGVAVHAAVFAAAVRIDGAVEGNVGRLVAADYAARPLDRDAGARRRRRLRRAGAGDRALVFEVVRVAFVHCGGEARLAVAERAAALQVGERAAQQFGADGNRLCHAGNPLADRAGAARGCARAPLSGAR